MGCGEESGQEASFGWRVWTCEVLEWCLERLGWSGSLCQKVVSRSARIMLVGATPFKYVFVALPVSLTPHVHLAEVSRVKVREALP